MAHSKTKLSFHQNTTFNKVQIIFVYNLKMLEKQAFKLGEMLIDQKQVFWKMQHCFALIPIVQLLDGHVLLTTKRRVEQFSQLEPVEVFDLSLAIRFMSKSLESYYNVASTTVHIQNATPQSPIKHLMVHVIPRKTGDLKNNDLIYDMLANYPNQLATHYNEKMNFYINAYANKILQGIHEQAKKFQTHLNVCFKQQKES